MQYFENLRTVGLVEPFKLIPNSCELILPRSRSSRSYWVNSVLLRFSGGEADQEVVSKVNVTAFYDTVGAAVGRGRSYLEFVKRDGVYDLRVTSLKGDSDNDSQKYNQADRRMFLDSVSLQGYTGDIRDEMARRLRLAVFLDCDRSTQSVFAFESQSDSRPKLIIPEMVAAKNGNEPLSFLKRARNGLMFPPGELGLINDLWGVFFLEPKGLMANEWVDGTGLPPSNRTVFRVSPSDKIRAALS